MAYIQKNNPIPITGCGRRRSSQMINPFRLTKASLVKVSNQLEKASKLHADQASKIQKVAATMKKVDSGDPFLKRRKRSKKKIKRTKISPACKAAAKRKFKVWPSAYASGWGVRCTRNPRKYLKRK